MSDYYLQTRYLQLISRAAGGSIRRWGGLVPTKEKNNKPDHEGNPTAPSPMGGLSAHTRKKKKNPDHEGCPSVMGRKKKKKNYSSSCNKWFKTTEQQTKMKYLSSYKPTATKDSKSKRHPCNKSAPWTRRNNSTGMFFRPTKIPN